MSENKGHKKGGGKLSRSEVVTVRLDPKLRYMAELAARKQRRTLSSFIEWSIEQSLKEVLVVNASKGERSNLAEMAESLWDVSSPKRLVKLAQKCPELLNYKEERIWRLVDEWKALFDFYENGSRRFRWELLDSLWKEFEQYGDEEITEKDLGWKVGEYFQRTGLPSSALVIHPEPRYIDEGI